MKCGKRILLFLSLIFTPCLYAMPIDIMLVMDGSGSLSASDYETQRSYANDFANLFTFGPNDVRMGVVQFSTNAQLEIGLSDNATVVGNSINNMAQQSGQTNHGDGFIAAHNEIQANGRVGALQAILFLTDGRANRPIGPPDPVIYAIEAANAIKNDGIQIYGLGFGSDIELEDLEDYVSSPTNDFAYLFDDYGDISNTLQNIATQLIDDAPAGVGVPEPQPLSLLVAGLSIVFLLRRRYREFSPESNSAMPIFTH